MTRYPSSPRLRPCRTAGFTLVEIAIVLMIVGLMLGGLMVPLATQADLRSQNETKKTLADIHEALLGFASARGRLPCPASPTSSGIESPTGGGDCTHDLDGFIPAATLGITVTDGQGFAVDAWGRRIRYAVTAADGSAFTTAGKLRSTGLSALDPNLEVYGDAALTAKLTTVSPAVIRSTGKNGAEESHPNPASRSFVSRDPAPDFDDMVTWVSPYVLYGRLISAGQLP